MITYESADCAGTLPVMRTAPTELFGPGEYRWRCIDVDPTA